MKKIFRFLAVATIAFAAVGCEYDDGDLWNKVNSLEQQVQANAEDIATLTSLVEALNKGKVITSLTQSDEGYTLTFNDGSSIEITNGKDGDSLFVSIVEQDGLVIITLSDGRVIRIPAIGYELRVLTFEDEDALFEPYAFTNDLGDSYTIDSWSSLIPAEQYGDRMTYGSSVTTYAGSTDYHWYDADNTLLRSSLVESYGGKVFWNGGQVISDFYSSTIEGKDYTTQLEVAVGTEGAAGNNGSKNFCVHNGEAGFAFASGEYVIDHIYVTNTAYVLGSLTYGDAVASAATASTWFKVVATGYNAANEVTGTTEFLLCDGDKKIVGEWQKFDLSRLGAVARVEFHLEGSDDLCGEWGLNTPKYFAFDDVAVRFPNR